MATILSAAGPNILVRVIDPRNKEHKTKGGIILPQGGPGRGVTLYGVVVNVGEQVTAFKEGQSVVFERSRCYEVAGTTATLAFLDQKDVLGTMIENDEPEDVKPLIVKPGLN